MFKLNKKRGSATLEVMICIGLITFILFFPVAIFSLTGRQTAMSTLLIHGLQVISLEGGLTPSGDELIRQNAEQLGFNPQRVEVEVLHGGVDITQGHTRVEKGSTTPIRLTIRYPNSAEVAFFNNIVELVGTSEVANEEGFYTVTGYVKSEWIRE